VSKRRPAKADTTCPCGNPATQGATICNTCVKATSRRLGDQQHHHEQLEVTFTRQGKLEAAPETGKSANQPLPYHTLASDLLREQNQLLTRWVKACVRDLHTPEPATYTVRGLSMHLEHHLPDLRKHPKAADLVGDLGDLCHRILACIDRQDRSYAIMPCPHETEDGKCPGMVWAFIPLSDPDSNRPSSVACNACETAWPPSQWSSLGRLIRKAAA